MDALVQMQLVLRASFPSHKTVRKRRLVAFAPTGVVERRKLVLNDETIPGIYFVLPAAHCDRGRVGRARGYLAAIGRNSNSGGGILAADRSQLVGCGCWRSRRRRG